MKTTLKKLRSSQPFNYLATTSVRALLRTTGSESEWAVRHLHRLGTVESDLPNGRKLRLWSRADDWVSNQVYWRGWKGYEPETAELFFKLAQRSRVTLDVGAYVGFFSLLAGHANSQGRVIAFEPLEVAHKRLESNVRLNGLTNVDIIRAAVGEVDGTASFFHVKNGLPTSSSLSYEFMKDANELTSSDVRMVSLDSFLASEQIEGVDLLKIDTESTEPDVLRGALKMLKRDRPRIVCEVLAGRGSARALEDLLAPLGYTFHLLTIPDVVKQERIVGHPHWLNYLFLPDHE